MGALRRPTEALAQKRCLFTRVPGKQTHHCNGLKGEPPYQFNTDIHQFNVDTYWYDMAMTHRKWILAMFSYEMCPYWNFKRIIFHDTLS